MNLLQLVQEFSARTGLPRPVSATATQSPQVQQMVALLNEELEELVPAYPWQQLQDTTTFSTVAAELQGAVNTLAGNKPVQRILNETLWDGSQKVPLWGPTEPRDWQAATIRLNAAPRYRYRVRNGDMYLYPAPPAGVQISFEFILRNAVLAFGSTSQSGTRKQLFTEDDDSAVFNDGLMMAALRWRWRREKGLVYAEDKARYERLVENLKMVNATKRTLNLNDQEECCVPKYCLAGVAAAPSAGIVDVYFGFSSNPTLTDYASLTRVQRVQTGTYTFSGDAAGRYLYIFLPVPHPTPFVFGGLPVQFVSNVVAPFTSYRSQFVQNGTDLVVTVP